MELTQVPYQIRPSPAIQCSSEEKHKISQEVLELLEKGAIVEAQLTQGSFVSQIFLVEKKEGGLKTGSQPQEPQLLHTNGALQDGGAPHPARPDPVSGLDDKDGSERCLSSDTSVSKALTPPPVSVECHNLPVQMPPIWPNISTSGVYQGVKTGGRDTETNGNLSNSIPG